MTRRALAWILGAAVVGVVLWIGSSRLIESLRAPRPGASASQPPARVLVVGLDGADWAILDPLLEKGRMPNLARLLRRGARAKLLTITPTLSPVVWTTIATGVEPNRHGVLDFLVADAAGGRSQPVTSAQRRVPTVWEILSAAQIDVGVVGWWATWPADPVKGYLVSDRLAYQLFDYRSDIGDSNGKTWPPGLYEEIRPGIVAPSEIDWSDVATYLDGPRRTADAFDSEERKLLEEFRTLLASGRTYLATALTLRRQHEASFEAVYFEGTDTVAHLFMPYRPPSLPGVEPARIESFRDVVDRYYETADGYLGRLLEGRDGWTIVILSDHGFATDASRPRTSDSRIGHGGAADWHRRFGVLVLSGAHVRPGTTVDEATVYDIAPTILALFGQPVPRSWRGRALTEVLEPSFIEANPIRFRADDPAREPAATAAIVPDPASEELREKLRSLGYISSGAEVSPTTTTMNNAGVALLAEGKYAEAAESFKEGLRVRADEPMLLVNLGLALRLEGRLDEARGNLERAFRIPSTMRPAGFQLAQLHLGTGGLTTAERFLRAVLEKEPGAPEVHNLLGLVLEKKGALDAATTEFQKASDLDTNAAEPRTNLGNLAKLRGKAGEAESWYLRAIEADPFFMGSYNNLAMIYQDRGEIQKAIVLYSRALTKAPRSAIVLNNLGSLRFATGDRTEARRLWGRAIEADPSYPSPKNNLAGAELEAGNLVVAERLLEEALALDPNYGDARINLALLHRARREPEKAREELRRALDDPRARLTALEQIGLFELEQGRADRALPALLEARGGDPRNLRVLNNLGEAYRRLGRPVDAAEAWRASLARNPAQQEVKRRLEALEPRR